MTRQCRCDEKAARAALCSKPYAPRVENRGFPVFEIRLQVFGEGNRVDLLDDVGDFPKRVYGDDTGIGLALYPAPGRRSNDPLRPPRPVRQTAPSRLELPAFSPCGCATASVRMRPRRPSARCRQSLRHRCDGQSATARGSSQGIHFKRPKPLKPVCSHRRLHITSRIPVVGRLVAFSIALA